MIFEFELSPGHTVIRYDVHDSLLRTGWFQHRKHVVKLLLCWVYGPQFYCARAKSLSWCLQNFQLRTNPFVSHRLLESRALMKYFERPLITISEKKTATDCSTVHGRMVMRNRTISQAPFIEVDLLFWKLNLIQQ